MEYIGRDAPPEQGHGMAVAERGIDARAPQLENLARRGQDIGDVVFTGGIETTGALGRGAPVEPVGADHGTV